MKKVWLFTFTAAVITTAVWAADWPMPGGNPQHNGWAKSERLITEANVGALKLLFKYQTDNVSKGLDSLTPPIVNGNLITYRGFKEMLMFGGSADRVFSVDADLNKLLWENRLPYLANKPPRESLTVNCPGGLTAPLAMAGSSSASIHFASQASRTPAASGARPARPSHYFPPLAQSIYPLRPTTFTQLNALYAVSSDGYLHVLNSSTGQDLVPPVRFVPPNAKVTSLNLRENVIYATTGDNCDGYQSALFAIDLLSPEKTVSSFVPETGGFAGSAGTVIGEDGTIYVQVAHAPGDRTGDSHEAVVGLTPKDLKVKDYFVFPGKASSREAINTPGITPVVFSYAGKELLLAGSRNGRLYLLDSKSLGGTDHRTAVFQSAPMARVSNRYDGNGFRGTFSTWLNVDTGTRWVYVPVFGDPVSLPPSASRSKAAGGAYVVALHIDNKNGEPSLVADWVSRNMDSPAPVVIANGMVFALATGQFPRLAKKDGKPYDISELKALQKPAMLYVMDARDGKELYASGETLPRVGLSAELALANGRVYLTGEDNAVYCFGIADEQRQLVEQ